MDLRGCGHHYARLGFAAPLLLVVGCIGSPITPETTTTIASTTTTSTTTPTTSTTTTTTLPPVEAMGRVADPDGRPIARVEIRFGLATTVSGPDGSYFLTTPDPGDLTFSKPGRERVEIEWLEGESQSVILQPITVRALRVGGPAAGDRAQFERILELAATTAVNTLLFDTKQEGGQVVYQSEVEAAHEIGAVVARYDPREALAEAEAAGLYTITRIVAFEDRFWADAHRDERLAGPWVDPAGTGARRYNLDLAREACQIGFDEIQFDYVRYPTGVAGRQSGHRNLPEQQRVDTIASFLEEARAELAPMGCALSADIFGIVVSTRNDQSIGQRPEELSRHLDAISPMVYPSHYDDGWIGLANPNDHPYRVVANALDSAAPRIEAGVLRPWLQGFWWTNAQIRESIQAAEDRGVGWLLWNSGSRFERASLPANEDVEG